MSTRRAQRRSAYTLLEVLLAAAIGVILLAAVYVALDIQMRSAQAGRDRIERTTLARSLLAQMGNDVSQSLGTIDPSRFRPARGGRSSGSTTPASSSSTSTTGGTTSTTGGAASTTTTTDAAATTATDSNAPVKLNVFVQGDERTLTVYVSRFPRELQTGRPIGEDAGLPLVSDLRRITYWLVGDADAPLGLARLEIKVATAEEALNPSLPEGIDETALVIAPEIKRLRFTYFDGSQWLDSWDGSVAGSDGYTPLGAPLAIAIEIGVAPPGPLDQGFTEADLLNYRHVVAIPVANGPPQQSESGTTTTSP